MLVPVHVFRSGALLYTSTGLIIGAPVPFDGRGFYRERLRRFGNGLLHHFDQFVGDLGVF